MYGKRKFPISESDIDYLHENVKYYIKKNVYNAKSFVILCKTASPNSGKVKMMEYELAKEMGDLKHAASILGSSYNSSDSLWSVEVSNMFAGLRTSQQYQTLPQRVQSELFSEYCEATFPTAELKAEFILQIVNDKSDILGGSHFLAFVCDKLTKLLITAEADLWESQTSSLLERHEQHGESMPVAQLDMKPPEQYTPKPPIDTEEGEVLEDLGESGEEDFEEDESNDGKTPAHSNNNNVLNTFKMKLTCEVLPFVHGLKSTVNLSATQIQTLVYNSLQFLFTFSSEIPFRSPEISGPPYPVPEILKMNPDKYFRTFLDMVSDLLNWPIAGPSFQVQSRLDVLERLRNCFHVYKDMEHDMVRSKKRSSSAMQKLAPIVSQAACIYRSLFIEIAIEYIKELKSFSRCPFNTSIFGVSMISTELPFDEPLSELLSLLQSLWSLRARYIPEIPTKTTKSKLSTIVLLETSLRANPTRYSGLLEAIVGLHLSLSSCEDPVTNFEKALTRQALADFYTLDQFNCLRCLYDISTNKHASSENSKVQRLRIVDYVSRMPCPSDVTTSDDAWRALSKSVISVDLSTSAAFLEVSIAVIETWLNSTPPSTDAAAVVFVLHQNPIWSQLLTPPGAAQISAVIAVLDSDWSNARGLFLTWLNAGFIVNPNFITHIVRFETGNCDDADFLDACAQCMRRASNLHVIAALVRFLGHEKDLLKKCLSL